MYSHTPGGVRTNARTGAAALAALSVLATGAVVLSTSSTAAASPTMTLVSAESAFSGSAVLAGPFVKTTARSTRDTHSLLTADATTVQKGDSVTFAGKLTAGKAERPVRNQPIRLEENASGDWKTIGNALLADDGSVTFTVQPAKSTKYRLAYAGVNAWSPSLSAEQAITVKVPPPPPPPTPVVRVSSSSGYSNAGNIGSAGVPASGSGAAVVAAALAESGKPYIFAAAGPNAFDCSGLTMYVFAQFGVYLPHDANAQQRYGTPISAAEAAPGDLMVFLDGGYGYHAGIYAGGGMMIDAPNSGSVVGMHSIWSTNVVFRRLV